jgi:hypothetical protein
MQKIYGGKNNRRLVGLWMDGKDFILKGKMSSAAHSFFRKKEMKKVCDGTADR